jgi:outer membrane protein assembly factor BamA
MSGCAALLAGVLLWCTALLAQAQSAGPNAAASASFPTIVAPTVHPTAPPTISASVAAPTATAWPRFKALEAAGATIGEVRVTVGDIFDTADPLEDKALFRWANQLHISTRARVIEQALLFKRGDKLSVRLLEETERLLRNNRFLYDVQFRVLAVQDGVVDIEVFSRDTWSLDPGISAGRTGGVSTGSVRLLDYNFLGTGSTLGLARARGIDRNSTELLFRLDNAFGNFTSLAASVANNSDGRRSSLSVVRPFYALDARWAGGFSASQDERIDPVYRAGKVASQYRHKQTQAEAFAGWSAGLQQGWVQRWSAGLSLQDDSYAADSSLSPGPPPQLASARKLVAPFVRFELLQDRTERELNRNLIGRPEFFSLGFASTVQLGWASKALGSSESAGLYSATVSKGFEPLPHHTLIVASKFAGQWGASGGVGSSNAVRSQRLGLQAQYYAPQSSHWLFYAGAAVDHLWRPEPNEGLQLGGDNGLRGFPLRYQSGTRRVLLTVEERFFTDIYLWRLFRVGGAAFLDAGRAWQGAAAMSNTGNPGWLGNVGAGLRIMSARSAFGNVLHVDLAMPLGAQGDIKRLQFLLKSRTSF